MTSINIESKTSNDNNEENELLLETEKSKLFECYIVKDTTKVNCTQIESFPCEIKLFDINTNCDIIRQTVCPSIAYYLIWMNNICQYTIYICTG